MVTIRPARTAWISRDAARTSAPNYDEFGSDREVRERIAQNPDSILRVTMPHCDGDLVEGSAVALARAVRNLEALRPLFRPVEDVLFVYRIAGHQTGLGGMALTGEIGEAIIRNEGIREEKARGRADLVRATGAFVGMVNHAVADRAGALAATLARAADARPPDAEAADDGGRRHQVWLLDEPGPFVDLLAAEPEAYVADGNHRSAAAAMAGCAEYLGVFFPLKELRIEPYNRLLRSDVALDVARLTESFSVEELDVASYQPRATHEIGLYAGGRWRRLRPKPATFDEADAALSIDAAIVQRRILADLCGIEDPRDSRIVFSGGAAGDTFPMLVDKTGYSFAITLPPVTPEQFAAVCRQRKMMPPKSTWFEPKVRSGIVMVEAG